MADPIEMTAPLVRVTRAGVQDNLHRGVAVAATSSGEVLLAIGDPSLRGYIRSAAKPIQCIPVITSGAAEVYGLEDADIAIISGSHWGGESQVRQVQSILAKAGLKEDMLQSGSGIKDNCSGKHSGKLAACRYKKLDLDSYLNPAHPHQIDILDTLRNVCSLDEDEVHIGVDGCGAPIHNFTVLKMAMGYARMSEPAKHFPEDMAAAISRVTTSMAANPGGHTGEPAYADSLGGEVRFLSKSGGNGVYCAGVVEKGIGFAMKVEDGGRVPLKPVFIEVMRRLGVLSDKEAESFRHKFIPVVDNRRGTTVGETELLF